MQMRKDVFTAFFMGVVLPGMLLNGADSFFPPATVAVLAQEEAAVKIYPMRLKNQDGTVDVRNMDSYLLGVVLGEMPASFEEEALKAQAVVARTYTQKAYVTGGKHGDNSVCKDPSCCQAYLDPQEYLAQGGSLENVAKVRRAVEATCGEVLTFGGELIEGTYFSCSGGRTEDAAAVWGSDYPYLQSVPSPGEEGAAHFTDNLTFTMAQFQEALGIELPEGDWLGEITCTEGGGVATMVIGGKTFTGVELRKLLGLPSTAFTLQPGDGILTITTKGYGHRVGMSQYGADAMAAKGCTYQEILAHYYQGTELVTLPEAGR